MARNTFKRDKCIYYYYKSGSTINHLSGKYGLKPTTITKIIKKCENAINEKESFIYNMKEYLRKNYSAFISTNITNALERYFKAYNIIFVKEILDIIQNIISGDMHIRGIGDKSKRILDEYYKVLTK